jgi:hypothetical protein
VTTVRLPPGSPSGRTTEQSGAGRRPVAGELIRGVAAPPPPPRGPRTLGDAIGDFVRRHGWRAYALPVLTVVTIVALVQGGASSDHSQASAPAASGAPTVAAGGPSAGGSAGSSAPTAGPQQTVKVDQPGANVLPATGDTAALPPGAPYTAQGAGTFAVVKGNTAIVGTGPLRRYTIEYENGITGIDVQAMAATIDATLGDPRSWTAGGQFSLQRVDSGSVDFRITLVSSMTVRTLCGYEEQIETSCFAPDRDNRVVLNNSRWARGAMAYANDLETYRLYMINHEVGHALGFGHVFSCRGDGKAPTMMQQTKSVVDVNGATCQPNPWPNP